VYGTLNSSDPLAVSNLIGIQTLQAEGEWTNIVTDIQGFNLSVTACYTSFVASSLLIMATRPERAYSEPVVTWNSTTQTFDTVSARHELGALALKPPILDRGIFLLKNQTSWDAEPSNATALGSNLVFLALSSYLQFNTTVLMCAHCLSAVNSMVSQTTAPLAAHLHHVAIFNDILRDTRNPALALQAHFTTLFGMAYYDHLVQFDLQGPAILVQSMSVSRPIQKKFFWIVVGVNLVHVCIVGLICSWFCGSGRWLLLGGNWQVLGLMGDEDAEGLLRKVGGGRDEVVRRRIADLGFEGQRVGVRRVGRRVRILRKEE
jgi:hypothetical protein